MVYCILEGIFMDTARLSSKGQVTIPARIRQKLGRNSSLSKGWSKEFVAAFSQFSKTADDTFIAHDEIPLKYCTEKAGFE